MYSTYLRRYFNSQYELELAEAAARRQVVSARGERILALPVGADRDELWELELRVAELRRATERRADALEAHAATARRRAAAAEIRESDALAIAAGALAIGGLFSLFRD